MQKLIEACEQKTPTMSGFLNALESSGWLKHIRSILDTSRYVNQGFSQYVQYYRGIFVRGIYFRTL